MVVVRLRGRRNGEMYIKGYKLSVVRSSEDLMYSMMILVIWYYS